MQFTSILGLISLLVITYFSLNRLLIKPIKLLTEATKTIGYPDRHKPLGMERNDEIGDLAKAFDDMVETLDARDEEVKLLLETSVAVSSALKVDKVLQLLCEKISESQKVTYCRISLYDKKTESLTVMAASSTRNISDWEQGIGDSLDLERARHHAEVSPVLQAHGPAQERPTIRRRVENRVGMGSDS